jgi:lipopolysaccharide transport system ATP-binding protein
MSDVAIRVDGLSKQYRIGARQEGYRTLRETINRAASAPWRGMRSLWNGAGAQSQERNKIWALKDISFEIRQGDVVGVIGRNGAGKSTLLKILSRITSPSLGYAEIHGRVGSLLEVGTGFHPELTGRENIFLNGAILGMRRSEIERQFDAIVAFSEVEQFIDTPVKHYSSGMYLRLAFSVAAHMEPEILVVDEVLAVGDAAFQKKCIGKMGEVANAGRTVFFVSHNLGAVKELCTSSLILSNGKLDFQGGVTEGLGRYSRGVSQDESDGTARGTRWSWVEMGCKAIGDDAVEIGPNQPIIVQAMLEAAQDFVSTRMILLIENSLGDTVVHHKIQGGRMQAGRYEISAKVPPLPLAPGVYTAYFKFFGNDATGFLERHLSDRVLFGVSGSFQDLGRAVLAPSCEWDVATAGAYKVSLA